MDIHSDSDEARNVSAITPRPRRRYRSPVREAAAAETRERILAAAAECFADRGYAATTLPQIAQRAGVSVESVAGAGPKRQLLIAAFEHAFGGREGSDGLTERPELGEILARADPDDVLEGIADFILEGQRRGVGIWRAVSAAADQDEAVGELYRALAERRRQDNLAAVRVLAAREMVRTDVPIEDLADTMALLNGFDPYQLFVREFGWTPEHLRQWYVGAVRALVLRPD